MLTDREWGLLEQAIGNITTVANQWGLDYYPMRYEICPADIVYTMAAYGMPTRFSHWSFGKAFHKLRLQYDYRINKIYELVINANPCYAFLLEENSLIQNKLVCAHVLGHSDFFKNNRRFDNTRSNMLETMSVAAERFQQYEVEYGIDRVEQTLDAVIAVQEHIDPSLFRGTTRYSDKDMLHFIMKHSKVLVPWQVDIISTLREEMLYFWPQIETKIMNEGWASYWHIKILRELELTPKEAIEFAKLNAQVLQPAASGVNPYLLGLKIYEDIVQRYGEQAIFDVREVDSDQSFLRNYLTEELVESLDLYVFSKVGLKWKITDKNWQSVRDRLVESCTNGGFPVLIVKDGDYFGNGELYIEHRYEGVELDIKYLEKTLPHVYHLWGRDVYIQTVMEKRNVTFMYDGNKVHRRFA